MSHPWPTDRPLPQLVQEWLDWLSGAQDLSPATVKSWKADIRAVLGFTVARFALDDLTKMTEQQLQSHFVEIKGRLSPNYIVRRLTAVRSLLRYWHARGLVQQNVALLLGRPRRTRMLPRYLPYEDVLRLFEAVKGEDPKSVRLHAILQVFYATGVRVSELVWLQLADVDVVRGTIIVMGKGRKERKCELHGRARVAVATWIAARTRWIQEHQWEDRDEGTLLINFRDGGPLHRHGIESMVSKLGVAVGLKRSLTPHDLRRTFATHMRHEGVELDALQDMLGHASIDTTMIYAHVLPQRLHSEYQKHPFADPAPTPVPRAAQQG